MGKSVAVKEESGGALAVLDYGEDAGRGFQNQTSDDLSIPFLAVLQSNSPQVGDVSDGGIAGAKAGMIFNTVTNDVYDGKEGVILIPCLTQHVFVEWTPRDKGGGFVGIHETNAPIVNKARDGARFGKFKTDEGNDLIETFYVYGLQVLPEGRVRRVVLGFSSTKIKPYKHWMTKADELEVPVKGGGTVKPPLYGFQYRLTTWKDNNVHGDFFVPAVEFEGGSAGAAQLLPDSRPYLTARVMERAVETGAARAAYDSQDPSDAATGGSGVVDEFA